jgi:DNA polymerase/3'-5' exonuclease PolX
MSDFPYDRDVDADAELEHRGRAASSSSKGRAYPLVKAVAYALGIVRALQPVCDRIEVAGSIRRRVRVVHDVEIVCVPRARRDLFGELIDEPTALDRLVDELLEEGRLAPRLSSAGTSSIGSKAKRLLAVKSGLAIDVFAVLPPAQWGAILAIRTGPADFSRRLVTVCKERGLDCRDGRLVARGSGRELATPEEEDFFRACGVTYLEPWMRR